MHYRALFNYDPDEDLFIPCRELGIAFNKGDILHVTSQEDPNWWQAYRDGEDDHALAGLIPSRTFWEQHEATKLSILADTTEATKNSKSGCRCLPSKKKSTDKNKLAEGALTTGCHDVSTYLSI
jgi:MAGUK p55 subfamily protein 5